MKFRFKNDALGVSAFFEDVPALIVVTVGVSIFLSSVIIFYPKYVSSRESENFVSDSHALAEAVRCDQALLWGSGDQIKNGVFDASKIRSAEARPGYLGGSINTPLLYNVEITDTSDYPAQYDTAIVMANASLTQNASMRYVTVLPVCIKVSDGEVHSGKLTVITYKMR